ncbi:MAG: gamma-glutamyl-gamma-aminobutyrate hydrolase family protein [Alphaproteobacteria bacterium]|nr:MAG: gamma-glutamyl-gamma-aminobutyrate hydrolase family protein [Alphaproteobacteria bacterium]
MSRPVVGIIGNIHVINDQYVTQAAGRMNIEAVARVCEALPLIVPALPDFVPIADLMASCDGFVFTGGRPNVHPSFYGQEETEAHGPFDRDRDALVLPLIRACVEGGVPILGLCRGFQEIAVAFGSTLHPEIRELPGRMNHRMPPEGSLEEKFALRHDVRLTPGGRFAQMFGAEVVRVNSLHGQGVCEPGERVIIEGRAEDGTPEALHIAGAPGFAMAVQWHAEWQAAEDPVSRALFKSFAGELGRARKAA